MYGGVPIIDNVQNPIIGDSEGIHLVVPRSSTKECIDVYLQRFANSCCIICQHVGQSENKNFGRITSGAALGFKGSYVELLICQSAF